MAIYDFMGSRAKKAEWTFWVDTLRLLLLLLLLLLLRQSNLQTLGKLCGRLWVSQKGDQIWKMKYKAGSNLYLLWRCYVKDIYITDMPFSNSAIQYELRWSGQSRVIRQQFWVLVVVDLYKWGQEYFSKDIFPNRKNVCFLRKMSNL